MKLSNKIYDILKWVVIIVLPALGTLYAALSAVWGWPYTEEIVTTVTAVDTFLGAVLCISAASYDKMSYREIAADIAALDERLHTEDAEYMPEV